jgi:hypothetical protein
MIEHRPRLCHYGQSMSEEDHMNQTQKTIVPLFFILLAASQSVLAQRRVFTNEDVQSPPPPAAAAPQAAPAPQSPQSNSGDQSTPAAAVTGVSPTEAPPADENAARRAAAEKLIQRMMEIQTAIREAGDLFFDKIREGGASEPTINKWSQVRDNLVLASDELNIFINEARRNLPPPAAPASAPAAQPQ